MVDEKKKKEQFIEAMKNCLGIVTSACQQVNISRTLYYTWRNTDEEFAKAVDEVKDMQIDFVEGKLMTNINNGDVTSIIFYLKTVGKARGYTDKAMPRPDAEKQGFSIKEQKRINTRTAGEKSALVKKLKAAGKYSELLDPQLDIAAALIVKRKMLDEEIRTDTKKSVMVESSREGNDRLIIDPRQNLYKELTKLEQDALKSLGMDASKLSEQEAKSPLEDLIEAMKK